MGFLVDVNKNYNAICRRAIKYGSYAEELQVFLIHLRPKHMAEESSHRVDGSVRNTEELTFCFSSSTSCLRHFRWLSRCQTTNSMEVTFQFKLKSAREIGPNIGASLTESHHQREILSDRTLSPGIFSLTAL